MNIGAVESTITLRDNFTQGIAAAAKAAREAQRDFDALAQSIPKLSRANSTFATSASKAAEAIQQLSTAQANALQQISAAAQGTTTLTTSLRSLAQANTQAATAADSHTSSGYNVGTMLERLALRVTVLAVAYKTLSTVRDSVSEAIDVTRKLAQIEAITNAGAKGVDDLRASFSRLADSTGRGPKELSDAYYLIASASQNASANIGILDVSAKASATGLGNTADIAKTLVGVINAYGASNLTASHAADVLFETVRQGGAEASAIAPVLGRVVALAAQMGVSFDQLGAFIATFTRLGVGADEAVTALRGTLNSLLTPSQKQEQALKAVGMSMAGLRAEIRDKGLTQAMLDLVAASKGNEDIIGTIIPNVRALSGVMAVYAAQGKNVVDIQNAITHSAGALDQGFNSVAKAGSFTADQISARWELFKEQLGQDILPAVLEIGTSLVKSLNADNVQKFADVVIPLIKSIGTILVAAAEHTDALKNAFIALIGIKLALWLTDAAGATKLLNAAITLLEANPLVAVLVAIGFAVLELKDHYHNLSISAQRDIDDIVKKSNELGAVMARLSGHGTVSADDVEHARKEYSSLSDELATLQTKLSSLTSEQAKVNAGWAGKAGLDEQISQTQALIAQKELQRKQDGALISLGLREKEVIDGFGKSVVDTGVGLGVVSNKEKEYAQRVEETKAKIAAAVDEAKARLGVEQAVHAAIVGGNTSQAEAIARNAEKQAKINELVVQWKNQLEDINHKLGPEMLGWLKAQAAAIVDAGKATDDLKAKDQFIVEAKKKQLELQQKQAEEYRKQQDAIAKITEKIQDQIDEQNHQLEITKQATAEALSGGSANAADVVKLADRYYKEIGDHTERGAKNAHDLAVQTAQIAAEQEKYDALLKIAVDAMQPMWKTYLQMGMDAINAVSSNLAKGLADAMTTGTVDIKDIWKSLVGDLASIFANFLADLVKRWLEAELAKTAITLTQSAIRNTADGGSGGGSNNAGDKGSVSTLKQGYGAYQQYQSAGGYSALSANTAGTGAGGGYSAAGGAGYTLGVAAIWVAAIFTFLNYVATHIEKMGSGAVGLTGSPIAGQFTYTQGAMGGGTSQHNQGQVDRAGAEIAAQLNAFVDQAAIYAVKTVDIGLKKKGQGGSADWIVYVNGIAEHFGKDIDAAESYAYVQLLKNAELKGLPKEVTDAIHNTAATTADQLNQEITNAYTLFFEKLGEVGAQVYQVFQKYQTQINDQINKVFASNYALLAPVSGAGDDGFGSSHGHIGSGSGPGGTDSDNTGGPITRISSGGGHKGVQDEDAKAASAETQTIIALVAARNRELQAIRDSLLGLDTSGAKRLADIASYNAGIAASHDIVQAEIDKINDEIAKLGDDPNATAAVQKLKSTLQQYIDELNKAPDQIKGVQLDMAIFDSLFKYLPKTKENEELAAKYAQMKAKLELEALIVQITALGKAEEFADLIKQATDYVNNSDNFKPNKGGGHGGATGPTRQDAQQFLKDQAYALAEAGKTALQQQIDNIHKQYAEEEKAAGKDAKLKQQLIAQEAQAVAAAVAAAQADVIKQFNDLVGPQDAFTKLRAQYDAMRKAITDAGFSAAKTAQMMTQLDEAEQKAIDTLASQTAADMLGNLANMLDDGLLKSKLLHDQQVLNWTMQVANLEAQYAILVANGHVAKKILDDIRQAIDKVEAQGPGGTAPGLIPNYGGTIGTTAVGSDGHTYRWDGSEWVDMGVASGGSGGSGSGGGEDPRQKAFDLLSKYENSNLNKWQQALNELNSDFATIRAQLGNTTEVANAYAQALQRIREEFLKGLSDFRDSLTNGQASGASVATQYSSAAANYRKLLAAVQGGDLSQADALQQAAQTYRDLAAQMFGTATGGFASVRDEILRDLNAILGANGMGGAAGSNVIGGPSYFAQAAQLQIAAVNNGTDSVVAAANNITDSLSSRIDSLNNRLDTLIATSQSIDRGVEALDQGPPPAAVGYGNGG